MDIQNRRMIGSEEIYEDMCKKIEHLEYMPGEMISENDLSKTYDTTRHIVRGALSKLKDRKLVEVYPQRGTFVSLIDLDMIAEILFVREALEQEAFRRVFESGKGLRAIADRMASNIKEQERCLQEGGADAWTNFFALDSAFHETMFDAIGKDNMIGMIEDQYIHFRRWRNLEIRELDRMKDLVRQHKGLVAALRKSDEASYRTRLHEHIDTRSLFSKLKQDTRNQFFYETRE